MGHFMRSFGVIKLEPTGICSDVNDTKTWWNQVRRHTDPSSRFRKRVRSRSKSRSNKKLPQKSRNRRSVATFTRRYVNRNKAKWSEIRELVRLSKSHFLREKNYFSQDEYTLSSLDLIKVLKFFSPNELLFKL